MNVLIRHFLARTFDSEMFSARGQWGTVAVSAVALLLPAGMILLETQAPPGPARELTVLIRVLAIMGMMTLSTAPALFPSRRDFLALAALPVRPRQIFLARFTATLILALCATAALAVPLSNSAARLITLTLGCLLIFFAIFAIHGLLLNFCPPRISTAVHGLLIVVCLGAGLATWTVSPIPAWTPPIRLLVRATAIAIGSALLTYLLAAARYRKLLIESPDGRTRNPRTWTFLRLLTQNPHRRAILEFIAAVFQRSRLHRMVLAGYAAGGLALMINVTLITRAAAHSTVLESVALYWPLGLSFVVLAGVRHAFVMPAELSANWIFQLTESQGRREWMSAVERFVIFCVIVPIHAALLPIAGVRLITLDFLIALTMFELLFQSWQQLPFTCSYVPGKNTLMELLALALGIVCLVIPLLANLIALAAASVPWFLIALAICTAAWIWTRRQRREGWGEAPLIFVDTSDDVISLSGAGHRPAQAITERERPGAPALTLRLYRALARAFPEPFRDRYATDLLQLTEDSIEPIWRRHGLRGLARLLFDLAIRLPIEHAADLTKDLRYGIRALAGSPGFTTSALTALTLGICIATCAISEMNGIVLREIPVVVRPHELIATQFPISYPAYHRFRAQAALFSRTAAYIAPVPFDVTLNQHSQRVWGHLVTASYFPTFGIRPALGRFFDASYDTPNRPPAVVLSHRYWREHFAADPTVVGQSIPINGRPATILGVAAPDFLGASPVFFSADLFLPITTDSAIAPELTGDILERPGAALLRFVARLRPDATKPQAEAALDTISRQFDLERGVSAANVRARHLQLVAGGKLMALRDQDLPLFTGFLLVLAALVMLIACASVANMMLARAAGRRREIAVRLAIGASRARIIRQLIVESMVITTTAGFLGFLGSTWLMHLLAQFRMPFPMPVSYDFFAPDARVLLLTLALTLVTGVVFGLVPALQATNTDLTPALKAGGEVRLGRHRRFSVRNLLIVSQVAGSLTLLVILGLLSVGIQSTLGVQAGFNPAHLYLLSLDPVRDGYTPVRANEFFRRLLDRVQALPSVTAAALTESVPVSMAGEGLTVSKAGDVGRAIKHVTGKDYFATTGIPILAGRAFRRDDETGQAAAVIVSAAFAAAAFPGGNPIGRRVEIGADALVAPSTLPGSFDYRRSRAEAARRSVEIIGVAGNVAEGLTAQKPRPAMYFPLRTADYAQPSPAGITLIVRGTPGVDVLAQVRREIAGIDPNITTFNAVSMQEHIEEFMSMLRVASWTYAMIGLFGCVLAGVGLAGVTAYAVQQRRREIGIRMALGARAGNVLGLVMKEGAVLVAIGVVIGLAGAWAGSRGLAAMNGSVGKVTSTSTEDPVVILGSTALLIVLALLACYLPARRSTSIDAVIALRQE